MNLVEDIITGERDMHHVHTYFISPSAHNTGEALDIKAQQQFHLLLWRQASLAYEGSEFSKALSWYNYSLSLFPTHGDKDSNIAKLQVGQEEATVCKAEGAPEPRARF
jgi:hypothetical protein